MEAYRYLAHVYDDMMVDVDYASWAQYLHKILQNAGASRILDVACGTGNITRALFSLGYDITASDVSANMLRVAKETALREGKNIRFVRQNLRDVQAGNPVDAIVCACDGLNYIDGSSLKRFADSSYRALRHGGLLLFDVSTAYKLRKVLANQTFFDDNDDATCLWHNTFNEESNTLTMNVTLFVRNGSIYERFDEKHVQYAHDAGAVIAALHEAGYTRIDTYECFKEFSPKEDSHRIQFVCEKS